MAEISVIDSVEEIVDSAYSPPFIRVSSVAGSMSDTAVAVVNALSSKIVSCEASVAMRP